MGFDTWQLIVPLGGARFIGSRMHRAESITAMGRESNE